MKFLKVAVRKIGFGLLFIAGLFGNMLMLLYMLYLAIEFIPNSIYDLRYNLRNRQEDIIEQNVSDRMYEEPAGEVTLVVFQRDGHTYLLDLEQPVNAETPLEDVSSYDILYAVRIPLELEDGHFYEIVADVTYLYGGVAGYYKYPQINKVLSCEEITP